MSPTCRHNSESVQTRRSAPSCYEPELADDAAAELDRPARSTVLTQRLRRVAGDALFRFAVIASRR